MVKALVRDYEGVVIREKPLPAVRRGWLLVKTLAACWTPLEDLIASGEYWVEPGRVLGWLGYGVVVETGVEAPSELMGKNVAVVSYGNGVPGLDFDGWLTEYTSLPASSVAIMPDIRTELKPILSLAGIAATIPRLLSEDDEKVAIIGAGLLGILAAYSIAKSRRLAILYTTGLRSTARRLVRALGLEVHSIGELRGVFDAVVLSIFNSLVLSRAPLLLRDEGCIVLPPLLKGFDIPLVKSLRVKVVENLSMSEAVKLLEAIGGEVEDCLERVRGLSLVSGLPEKIVVFDLK